MLVKEMMRCGVTAIQSSGDADLLIAETAVDMSKEKPVAVIGEDTNLLILLLHYTKSSFSKGIYFTSEKNKLTKHPKTWNILETQTSLGFMNCQTMLAIHALLGCDTTSRL